MWITAVDQGELVLEDKNLHIYRWNNFSDIKKHIFTICNIHIDNRDSLHFEFKWMNEETGEEIYSLFVSEDVFHHNKILVWATNGILDTSQSIDKKSDSHDNIVVYSEELLQQSFVITNKELLLEALYKAINPFLADTDFSFAQRIPIGDEIVIWNTYSWKQISELIENYQSRYNIQHGTLCKKKFLQYLIEKTTT